MKILQVHNYYQQAGGEDVVLSQENELLRCHGHDVKVHSADNVVISGLKEKVAAAVHVAWSEVEKRRIESTIKQFKPDIVHVHNFFPLLTPSIFNACNTLNVPVVFTLHNYRIICPGALLMRDGKVCEDCVAASPFHSVIHGCYKQSRIASFFVARMVATHRKAGTWHNGINRYIALTQFAKHKFVEAGLPEQKLTVKPNFIELPDLKLAASEPNSDYAVYVGRLSEEKGLHTLVDAWATVDFKLKIIGDGPLFSYVSQLRKGGNIETLGKLEKHAVLQIISNAQFIIVPSLWFEGFPMVLLEAFALGLPAIVSKLGSLAEIVEDHKTGLHFTPGDSVDLNEKISWLLSNSELRLRLSRGARKKYLDCYTPEKNYAQLMAIYHEALNER